MKICIDARLWNQTGVGRYIQALITNLINIDLYNQYVVILSSQDFGKVNFLRSNWQKIKCDIPWHTFQEQLFMPGIYRRIKADIIHVPYFSVPLFIPKPFIVTIHDLTISHFVTGKATTKPKLIYLFKRLGYRIVLANAIKRSAQIITVSKYVKNQIIQEYKIAKDKINVIYESGEFTNEIKSQHQTIKEKYILYVGNAHPHKNLERLCQAFKLLLKHNLNFKLVFVGKIDYFYQKLRNYIQTLKIERNVVFLGFISNKDLPSWYNNALLFVFPSISEGFGIPGLEAMNQNCVVVASDIPTFNEIYENAFVKFNPLDINDISKVLLEVANNQTLRNKYIQEGKKQVSKYSWKKCAQETLRIYENSLSL